MWDEWYCSDVTVYEPEQRYSMVLDKNGRPYMYEPRREPVGFLLKPKEQNHELVTPTTSRGRSSL